MNNKYASRDCDQNSGLVSKQGVLQINGKVKQKREECKKKKHPPGIPSTFILIYIYMYICTHIPPKIIN